jgi:AraC family transcriptional regulator
MPATLGKSLFYPAKLGDPRASHDALKTDRTGERIHGWLRRLQGRRPVLEEPMSLPKPLRPRMATWSFNKDFTARLTFYPPDLRQRQHEHVHAQVSLVLAGNFGDRTANGEANVFSGAYIRRPAGGQHSVHYGRSGALILALESGPFEGVVENSAPPPPGLFQGLAARLDVCAGRESAEESRSRETAQTAASWLPEARRRLLHETLPIGEIAAELEIHRVHFARAFRATYGLSPSDFRLRSMLARALSQTLTHDVSLAHAALDAGFADQAHFARAMRSLCGVSASRLRKILAPAPYASSIQDAVGNPRQPRRDGKAH